MNKKFGFYFSKGFKLAFYAMKKCSFFTKVELCFYAIISSIGRLFILLRPIFEIADMNLAAFVAESRNVCFPKLFQGTTKKRYVDLLCTELLTDVLIIVCYGLLVVLPVSMMMLYAESTLTLILHYVLTIGGLIPAYLFAINIAPAAFIASKTSGLDVSDYLLNSKATMKGNKVSVTFVYVIYDLLIAAILFGISFGFSNLVEIDVAEEALAGIIVGACALILALLYFVLMKFKVAKLTNLYLIYKDSAKLSKSIAVKPVTGENIGYAPLFSENASEVEKLNLDARKEGK